MKGKLILVTVKEPKEGMKVVAGTNKLVGTVVKMFQEKHRYYDYDAMWNVLTAEDTYVYFTKELQQIAIEYDTLESYGPATQTIPLSPDDYERALPLIGQEVEWSQTHIYDEKLGEGKPRGVGYVKVAYLITPSPIVYTEEEARELAEKYASDMYERIAGGSPPVNIEDWWDKHKKK